VAGQVETKLAEIIAYRAGVETDDVKPEVNVFADLGMDSVGFLDATYDIDREFKITLPVAQWMEKVNSGEATVADFFVFKNLASHVVDLVKRQ
jgi:acyl carrier protein